MWMEKGFVMSTGANDRVDIGPTMIQIDISNVKWWQWMCIGGLLAVGNVITSYTARVTVAVIERLIS